MSQYRFMAEELLKLASSEEQERPSRIGTVGRALGATALGAGLGTAAGYGLGAGANAISKHYTGQGIPLKYVVPAGTFLGGMSGLLLEEVRRRNLEDVKRAVEGN